MADASSLATAMLGLQSKRDPYATKRQFAQSMVKQGTSTAPVYSPLEGVARALQGGLGGLMSGYVDQEEKAKSKSNYDALAGALSAKDQAGFNASLKGLDPDSDIAPPLMIQLLGMRQQQFKNADDANSFQTAYGAPQPQPPQLPQQPAGGAPAGMPAPLPTGTPQASGFNNNVGNIRATNIAWDGKGAPQNGFETFNTPQQGANAQAGNFRAYVQQNPNITVAQALSKWAPPNENDTNSYVRTISEGTGLNPGMKLGELAQDPAAFAMLLDAQTRLEKGGLPQGFNADTFTNAAGGASPTPLTINMPGQRPPQQGAEAPVADGSGNPMPPQGNVPPAVPDVPRPAPNPQLVQDVAGRLKSGIISRADAEKEIQASVDRDWQVARDNAKMGYQQKLGDYEANRAQTLKQPQDNVQNESQLRGQFDNLQPVKDYRKSATVFDNAVRSYKTNTAAADLNLVYSFATMMDPGSVVREGEMGMVKATQNASDQVKAMVAAVSGGGRLSPEARENLMAQMANRYASQKQVHDQLADTFGGIADRGGMNRQNIVAALPEVKFEAAKKGGANGPQPGAVMDGYRFKGGDPSKQENWEPAQ